MMLIEAAVCVVIVGVMLVAALQTVAASARARRVQAGQARGPALARQLLAEVRQCRYSEESTAEAVNTSTTSTTSSTSSTSVTSTVVALSGLLGPDAGEVDAKSRLLFDDVDDYHGLSESSARGRDGKALKGGDDWKREVTVEYVRPESPDVVVTDDQGLKRITVTVTGPAGVTTTLVALRSKFGGAEQLPRVRTTYVTGITVGLRLGGDGNAIQSGTSLPGPVGVSP
jgi:hypothetical protein